MADRRQPVHVRAVAVGEQLAPGSPRAARPGGPVVLAPDVAEVVQPGQQPAGPGLVEPVGVVGLQPAEHVEVVVQLPGLAVEAGDLAAVEHHRLDARRTAASSCAELAVAGQLDPQVEPLAAGRRARSSWASIRCAHRAGVQALDGARRPIHSVASLWLIHSRSTPLARPLRRHGRADLEPVGRPQRAEACRPARRRGSRAVRRPRPGCGRPARPPAARRDRAHQPRSARGSARRPARCGRACTSGGAACSRNPNGWYGCQRCKELAVAAAPAAPVARATAAVRRAVGDGDRRRRSVRRAGGTPGHSATVKALLTCTFTTPGSYAFTVPAGATSVTVTALGAQGGDYSAPRLGGKGASAAGTFATLSGTKIDIVVGGTGGHTGDAGTGGYPDGGAGAREPGHNLGGAGGGGSSAATVFGSLLVIAGGGGGAGDGAASQPGAAGAARTPASASSGSAASARLRRDDRRHRRCRRGRPRQRHARHRRRRRARRPHDRQLLAELRRDGRLHLSGSTRRRRRAVQLQLPRRRRRRRWRLRRRWRWRSRRTVRQLRLRRRGRRGRIELRRGVRDLAADPPERQRAAHRGRHGDDGLPAAEAQEPGQGRRVRAAGRVTGRCRRSPRPAPSAPGRVRIGRPGDGRLLAARGGRQSVDLAGQRSRAPCTYASRRRTPTTTR